MTTEKQIKELKKIRSLAIYGKKAHYNAADRNRCWRHWTAFPALILNVITSSVLYEQLKDGAWAWIAPLIALMTALLLAAGEYFKFGKNSTEHNAIADRYLRLARSCSHQISLAEDGGMSNEALHSKITDFQSEHAEIISAATTFKPSRADFENARKGVADGEEDFTQKDLDMG